ncbi:DUF480 domain-containing protein [Vibrio sp. SS-MA-C1-2]|uniref:YceH family protein n=1 Tax=Vibrio sp. SS-MA-C1-2 TaxID=2908646 RepID=UPI001F258538|nr:DUF480 domain-containing protein [Vibrio sp. SS-MA-C1-2]UJF17378.1 DUF480 domain-containing protein [Vibrio sp. SS-MA-C1-2]
MELTNLDTRVIGCLLEKEKTTPEQYPLTLNALTTACNQKSSREPVMALTDAEVLDVIEELKEKRLVTEVTGFGARVAKFKHRFCNTEFGNLQFSEQELGTITIMLLRGPQSPGEIRTRTNRLAHFNDVSEVEAVLTTLIERGFVVKLPKESGKRDFRYMHLFSGEVDVEALMATSSQESVATTPTNQRISQLEEEVEQLKAQLTRLQQRFDEFL